MTRVPDAPSDAPAPTVRPAEIGDEQAIAAICAAGFTASSRGLLHDDEIARRVAEYYDPVRIRSELAPAPPHWSGYVVAEVDDRVVGATGGTLDAAAGTGQVLVLYLDLGLRGSGLGTALLERLSEQQRREGAVRQRVSVTAGNDLGLPFYRARGFREAHRTPFGPAPEAGRMAQSIVMERSLT